MTSQRRSKSIDDYPSKFDWPGVKSKKWPKNSNPRGGGSCLKEKRYPAKNPVCAPDDQIWYAVLRRGRERARANPCRLVAHEPRPSQDRRSYTKKKKEQSDSDTHACAALCGSVTTQMADIHLMFCLLLVVLIAAPGERRRWTALKTDLRVLLWTINSPGHPKLLLLLLL